MGELGFAFNDMELCHGVLLRIEITSDSLIQDCDMETDSTSLVKVKTLNISSHLLASESAYFHKILENGMEESDNTQVTLKINASKEVTLMDLLNFIYLDRLSSTTIQDLMDVQMAAEKFEVTSCTRYCSQKLPVSLDDQDDLPSSPQSIKEAGKKYLLERHRDLTTCKCQEEAVALPLSALEVD